MGAQKINAQIYHKTLQTNISNTTNEDIKFSMQMELDDLNDFHDGNVNAWFEEVVNNTGMDYESQKAKY